MLAYIFIAIFTIGSILIPTESAVLAQTQNKAVFTKKIDTMTKKDKFNMVNNFTKVIQMDEIKKMYDDDKQYCSVFPPVECFENGKPDELKTSVEIFQEQFCPNRGSFKCMSVFAGRCVYSGLDAYIILAKLLIENPAMLKLDLCTDGPYENEHLRHTKYLRLLRDEYKTKCQQKYGDDKHNNVTSFGLVMEKYFHCVENITVDYFGVNFLREYTKMMNIMIVSDVVDKDYLKADHTLFPIPESLSLAR